jgi:hypothetical protein
LKMRSYVAKQNEAMSPPITILIVLKLNSSWEKLLIYSNCDNSS